MKIQNNNNQELSDDSVDSDARKSKKLKNILDLNLILPLKVLFIDH